MKHDYDAAIRRLYGPDANWHDLSSDQRAEVEREIDDLDDEAKAMQYDD